MEAERVEAREKPKYLSLQKEILDTLSNLPHQEDQKF